MKTVPTGAQRILDARLRGEKPAGLVIVSLVGPLDEINPVVFAGRHEHDWRFLRGLQVCIFGKIGAPNRQVAIAIGQQYPSWLGLWDVEACEGADVLAHIKPSSYHKRSFELSDWTVILDPWDGWQNKEFMGGM